MSNEIKKEADKILQFYIQTMYPKINQAMTVTEYVTLCKTMATDNLGVIIVLMYNKQHFETYKYLCEIRDELMNL